MPVKERESKSPVSYRTRSKTGIKQDVNGSQSSKSESGVEAHITLPNMGEISGQCTGNTNNGIR